MTTLPALTRDIGQAERTLGALLEQLLEERGLSFPAWTTMVLLDRDGPLTRDDLVRRQLEGRVVPGAPAAQATIEVLSSSGMLAPVDEQGDVRLALTAAGGAVFGPIRQAVSRITEELYGDLPAADLEATHRTLTEIARRANARMAAGD